MSVPADAMDRRTFLRRAGLTGAAAVAATVAGPGRPPARADEELAPFLHGVASGDPLADRVILWTRVTPDDPSTTLPVTWIVASDVALTQVVRTGSAMARPAADHTVKVDVTGLEPYTSYFYAFEVGGVRSLVGRTRTAPAGAETDRLRFALVSCSSYQHGLFNAYARISDRDDLDAVLHLGDYVYEYGPGEYGDFQDHDPPHEMVALADYRTRYAQYRLDPDLRRLHQLYPFIATWDDHESADNSWRDGAANHNPDGEAGGNVAAEEAGVDWATRKADCQRAYHEWMPIRSTGDPAIIYRTLRYGDLAEIIVLDTRLEGRSQQLQYPGGAGESQFFVLAGAEDPERRMISDDQQAFLLDRLRSTTARWKLVAQQVIISGWNAGGVPVLPDVGADAPTFVRQGGNALNPDSWDGYDFQRRLLLDTFRDEALDNIVFLTGDVHSSWAFDMTPDPFNPATSYDPTTGEGAVGVEFVVPGITSPPLALSYGGPTTSEAIKAGFVAQNPQMKMIDVDSNGYAILDVDAARAQCDWFFVDTVTEPSDVETHFESWLTEDGANHLVQADAPAADGAPAPARPDPGVTPSAADDPAVDDEGGGGLADTGGGAAVLGVAAIAAAAALRARRRPPDVEPTDEA